MSQLGSASDDLQKDHPEVRRRRLLFRCWHRGTQEIDLLLGPFAETSLAGLTAPSWTGSKPCSTAPTPTCSTGSPGAAGRRRHTTTT